MHQKNNKTNLVMGKITADMIDWDQYKESVKANIANEELWMLGGSDFAEDNIAELEEELEMIEAGDFDELLEKYDDNIWEDYLK